MLYRPRVFPALSNSSPQPRYSRAMVLRLPLQDEIARTPHGNVLLRPNI
jgi:hypothetical protein